MDGAAFEAKLQQLIDESTHEKKVLEISMKILPAHSANKFPLAFEQCCGSKPICLLATPEPPPKEESKR